MQVTFGKFNAHCVSNDNDNDRSSDCDGFDNNANKETKIIITMMITTETTTTIIIIK